MGGLDRIEDRFGTEGRALDDPDAEALLRDSAVALLLGVLYDQQVRAEVAFTGPHRLKGRIGHLDPHRIALMDADAFHGAFAMSPAVHRFSGMMADRTQALMTYVVDHLGGDPATLWRGRSDDDIVAAARQLPGFGAGKVKTLLHALAVFGHR